MGFNSAFKGLMKDCWYTPEAKCNHSYPRCW